MTLTTCIRADAGALEFSNPPDSLWGSITGVVTVNGRRELWASINIIGTGVYTYSDSGGRFQIGRLPVGLQQVTVQQAFCDSRVVEIHVRPGMTETLAVDLRSHMRECVEAGKTNLLPGCFRQNPSERARVGRTCSVHPWSRFALDTVDVSYVDHAFIRGQVEAMRDSFPNVADYWDAAGSWSDEAPLYTEMVFCPECRRARDRWAVCMKEEQQRRAASRYPARPAGAASKRK